jgi:hypothetical protein
MACRIDTSTAPEDVLDLEAERVGNPKRGREERIPPAGIDLAKRVERQTDLPRETRQRNTHAIAVRSDQRGAPRLVHRPAGST